MPSMKSPEPLPQPKPLPMPQQAAPPPVVAPTPPAPVQAQAPLPPQVDAPEAPPPPQLTQGTGQEDQPVVKQRKSKRKELQQASSGTAALRIPLNTGSKQPQSAGGLNIPT